MPSLEEKVDRLEFAIIRLTEAQTATENRLAALTQRVDQLSDAVLKLTDNVARIEEQISKMASAIDELRKTVAGLSETIGFGLEDIAHVVLPGWIERHLGIKLDTLERRYFTVDGGEIEANIYGEGTKEGKSIAVIGEVKSRIYGKDVEEFGAKAQVIAENLRLDAVRIMFGYLIHPSAEQAAKQHSVHLVAPYHR